MNATLTERIEKARQAWPDVHVDLTAFATHLSRSVPPGKTLENIHVEDTYLAFACLGGDARALSAFEREVLVHVPRHIRRISRSPAFIDEVCQLLREKLLAGPSPKLAEYQGRGPLGGFVRVAAIRVALNEQRREDRLAAHEEVAESLEVDGTAPDPELDFLKSRYAPAVKRAFENTLRALSVDQRNVLRLHYLDRLTIDQIAAAYDVGRSSAARWIAEARKRVLDEVRRQLREAEALRSSEVESILALVQSQLELSLRFLLTKRA
jgi:RNA polymerase sigma-70 factor, ECF subfamily